MNSIASRVFLAFVLGCLPAVAQRHETFSERPSFRREKARVARERAQREKEEARQWAKARGLKMRHDDGMRVTELMAIRNGRPIYYTTYNDEAAISTAADQVRHTAPYNVGGTGVTVGIWDAGSVLETHREFASRVTNVDSASSHGHSTHVGGTIGASGIRSYAEGMVPDVLIDSYDWNYDEDEMTIAAASEAGEAGKIYLSNHSYGTVAGWRDEGWFFNPIWYFYGDWSAGVDSSFGQYENGAREWDEIVYDAPYFLPFKAAGNDRIDGPLEGKTVYYYDDDEWKSITYTNAVHPKRDGQYKLGFDTIPRKGNAKNIMTVGAVDDAVSESSRCLSNAVMTAFSSWGPADDGRIKPDIVANGVVLYSCGNTNDSHYRTMSGTSMSSPNACGSAALLVDYYDDLFPGDAMRASTLKGLIIHTADDLGNPGPDYSHGWGLMNTLAAAELLKDYSTDPTRLTEAELSATNPTDSYAFFRDGGDPLRVTLCWTDPPGTSTTNHDSRTAVLVNDLDLKVTGPCGTTTFWPYKLDYNNPASNATANSENDVDNVEQVYIAAPAAGKYTVTVDYDGSLSGESQWYSLLISGPEADSDGDGMPDHWETTYFMDPTNAVAAADSDGDGVDNLAEYVSGYNPVDSNSVFKLTACGVLPEGSFSFILTWDPVSGRLYNVVHTDNLIHDPFEGIPGATNLPCTQNSYTDVVERIGPAHLYRVGVQLDQ